MTLGFLPVFAGVIAILTIGFSYRIAYKGGHVSKWPGCDITHCMIQYPEYMVGRVGLISASFLMIPVWYVITWFLQVWTQQLAIRNQVTIVINGKLLLKRGLFASFLLMMSTAAMSDGDDMDWLIHVIGATGFFLMVLYNMIITINYIEEIWKISPGFIGKLSYNLKVGTKRAIYFLGLCLVGKLYPPLSAILPKDFGNILEWVATGVVMVGLISFGLDFRGVEVYLAKNR